MKEMECWVLLSDVQDRMIREPDDQVRGYAGRWRRHAWLAVIGYDFVT
jgi:hypothetical protein